MSRKRTIASLVLAILLMSLLPSIVATAQPAPAPIDPYIWDVLQVEGQADVLVVLKEQADLSGAFALETKTEKGWYVYRQLTEVAERTQPALRSFLDELGVTYRPYWIRNMFLVEAHDAGVVHALARRGEVAQIDYLYPAYPDPVVMEPIEARGPTAVEWNILRVNADDVWGMGITGAGAVVADLDTGVQWDHPALVNSYRPQIPGAPTRHDYNWWDAPGGSLVPIDYGDHGTHTMGTIVGDDGGANQIGMAPGAEWIACPGLGSPVTNPMDCFQFFLAPTKLDGSDPRPDLAPHVINNSWSDYSGLTNYHPIIRALYAAGIFYAKSAGNSGPDCGTLPNPGQWPEVTAVAAFDSSDTIASFSSRGPVTIGRDTVLKPDIAAPGVNVRSSVPGDGYGYKNGTSMSCPHVAGAVALLISANPNLAGEIDIMQMILKLTAEPVVDAQCPPYVDHPNDVWGWGILDIHAAVLLAQATGIGGIEGQVYDSSNLQPIADAEITFADTATGWPLFDTSAASGYYSRTLPAATYDITATHYGYLPGVIPGVVVSDGVTTTLDIPLDPAPVWTVSGTVTETQTGDPLAATILFEETPVTAQTDPTTGFYSTGVAQGTWWIRASSPGHVWEERLVTVDQDITVNFSLPATDTYYMKAGAACGPAFNWRDATGGSSWCLPNDSTFIVMPPSGRTFTFYGNSYDFLYLGSNGLVSFGAGYVNWSGPIPDPEPPNNAIYAFSTNLNPDSCNQGTIYTEFQEDRYFVIQFDAVEHYPSGNPETFEIVLDLDTGAITIQFLTVSDPSDAVVGVENADGTEAIQYAYDDPVLITDSVAVGFHPAFGTPPPTGDEGQIEGTVTVSGTGAPIAGATVNAVAFTGGETFTFTTDASGYYSGSLCADWYTMTASAPGYYPSPEVQAEVLSGTVTVQDFALELIPCAPVQGADFDWAPITPTVFEVVAFTGSVTAGDPPIAYDWDLGDGNTAVGITTSHAYTSAGTYTVVMTATNCQTATATAVHTVTVVPLCNPVEIITVTTEISGCVVTFGAELTGTVPFEYLWDLGALGTSTATNPVVDFGATGTYTVTLHVWNCQQAGHDMHTFTVDVACAMYRIYLPIVLKNHQP